MQSQTDAGDMFSQSSCVEAPRSIVDSGFEWNFTHLLTPAHLKNKTKQKKNSKADFIKEGGAANKSWGIQDNTFKEHMSHGKSSLASMWAGQCR